MDLKEIETTEIDPDKHWYYQSKAGAMLQLVNGLEFDSILDIGAGSGFFSKYILQNTTAIEATCIDTGYTKEKTDFIAEKKQHFCRTVASSKAQLVLMMDVIEHIEDDISFIQNYVEKCSSGTTFLVSVPAFNFLWSEHDVFLEHYRRYTIKSLRKVLKSAGLEVTHSQYFFGVVFVIPMVIRLLKKLLPTQTREAKSQMRNHSFIVNYILHLACKAEIPLMRSNKLAGLSVFCLAQKP